MKRRNERISPRISLTIPIEIQAEGRLKSLRETCMSENLSARGICFVTHLPLLAGSIISMVFIMPRELTERLVTPFRYTGCVLRVSCLEGMVQRYRVAASLLWLTDVHLRKSGSPADDHGCRDAA
jgi:hypothetical protein